MTKETVKRQLIRIDNVRITEGDDRNVIVERLEETTNPTTKEVSESWKFKGYSRSILSALKMISSKELLIDRNAVSNLESYLKAVEESNAKILKWQK